MMKRLLALLACLGACGRELPGLTGQHVADGGVIEPPNLTIVSPSEGEVVHLLRGGGLPLEFQTNFQLYPDGACADAGLSRCGQLWVTIVDHPCGVQLSFLSEERAPYNFLGTVPRFATADFTACPQPIAPGTYTIELELRDGAASLAPPVKARVSVVIVPPDGGFIGRGA